MKNPTLMPTTGVFVSLCLLPDKFEERKYSNEGRRVVYIHVLNIKMNRTHARIQRGGGGAGGLYPPEKSQKYRVS